ncbi:MAG: Asp/Glu racemase [Rhodobacteraceae bacterium]|nr:Asp/Glu racemase [Paracoccaceae bacterium]
MSQALAYRLTEPPGPRLGLIALQSDETIERDLRRLLPETVEWMVSRVPMAPEVTSDTLAQMETALTGAAALFPLGLRFDCIGYGCTSGTAQIGADVVAGMIRAGVRADAVTEPLSALVAACGALNLKRIAVLSPYVASVSDRLHGALAGQGVTVADFGSFNIAEEAAVVRIDPASIRDAALQVMRGSTADALFLSCTNLRALEVVETLETELNLPVLTSNQVLAWHMLDRSGGPLHPGAPGRLFRAARTKAKAESEST